MPDANDSIFRRYYADEPFVDRFLTERDISVDVIIPVIHSNELWEANLRSFYREIPIYHLLIGDGGCIDNTIEIVRKFPRVTIFDQRKIETIGYCERKLIEAVETEWFIHLHSDVFLPDGWFDTMEKYKGEYDYYGCVEQDTILIVHENDYEERPWAGAQFVRKHSLKDGLLQVDDDYIYRQGDYVYRRMVEQGGFKEGRIKDTFHYHQIMYRPSPWARKIKSIRFELDLSKEEEIRTLQTQIKGLVKYLDPDPHFIPGIVVNMTRLQELGLMTWQEFLKWVEDTNPLWLPLFAEEAKKHELNNHLLQQEEHRHAIELKRIITRIILKFKKIVGKF